MLVNVQSYMKNLMQTQPGFYDERLWVGCINHGKLFVVAQVFNIKSDHGLSKVGYDRIIE